MHHGNSKNPPLIVAFMLSNCESMTMSTTYQLQRTHNLIPTESYCHPGFFILEINTLCSLDRFCGMVDVYNYIMRVVGYIENANGSPDGSGPESGSEVGE